MYYCTHCGSSNTKEDETGNHGDLLVVEEFNHGFETWDGDVAMVKCNDCNKLTYASK